MKPNNSLSWIAASVFISLTVLCALWATLRMGTAPAHATTLFQTDTLRIDIEPGSQTLDPNTSARFTITVQNTGSDPLTNLRVESSLSACQQALAATLAPGAVTGYTCSTAPLRADLTLALTVFATTPAGALISARGTAAVNVIAPQIDVALSPGTRQVLAGSPATFTVAITNRGEFTLAYVVATDPVLPDCSLTDERVLPVGARLAYACGLASATEDFTHTVTVEGSPPVGRIVTDTTSARVQIIEPALALDLLPETQTVPRQGQAELTVRIANNGDAQLVLQAIDAPLAPRCAVPDADDLVLNSGEIAGYTCSVDVNAVDFIVTATARASTPLDTELTARASAAIDVLAPDISLHAEPLSQTVTTGTDATVLYTVTNGGNYPLDPVTLTVASTPPYGANCDRTVLRALASGSTEPIRCTVPNVTSFLSQTATVAGAAAGELVSDSLRVDMNAFPFATVRGTVWEDMNGDGLRSGDEPGLAGVTVNALSAAGNAPVDSAMTDESGAYALRRVPPGPYRIEFVPPEGYTISPRKGGDAPENGSDADPVSGLTDELLLIELEERDALDAGLYRPIAVAGQVWEDANANGVREPVENALTGVTAALLRSGEPVSTTRTGANGLYTFASLPPATYAVEISLADDRSQFSPHQSPAADQPTSAVDPATGRTEAAALSSGTIVTTFHAGIYRRAVVAGRVWHDANLNGIQEGGEGDVPGVIVRLFGEGDALFGAATTDSEGRYIFTGVDPGRYDARFEPPDSYRFISFRHRGSDPALDSDVGADGRTALLTLAADDELRTLDAAVARPGTTDAAILNLDAQALRNGVEILWLPNHALQGEASLSRFRLWRSENASRGDAVLITPQPLRITGAPHAQHYLDTAVTVGQRYTYWIESEDVSGTVAEFGPVSATPDVAAERTVGFLYLPLAVRQLPEDDP